VSNNDKFTSQELQKPREITSEAMSLKTATENWQRWCGRDMARQSVPGTSSGDRKSSITDYDRRRDLQCESKKIPPL